MEDCPVCFDQIDQKDIHTLKSCEHKVCKQCLTDEWQINIDKQQVSEQFLQCPIDQCNKAIHIFDLKELLSQVYMSKYDQYSFQQYVILNDNEKRIKCPKPDCKGMFTIWKEADYTTCQFCKFEFCTQCFKKVHHQKSCDDANKTEEEIEFDNFAKENLKKCPECQVYVEHAEHCKFMTCHSKQCAGKTYFCFICGSKLTRDDHFSHYKDRNPYGDSCIKYNKYQEKQKEKKRKLQENQVDDKDLTYYSCKKCEEICLPEKNFGNKMINCKKCNIFICVTCHRDFKIQDQNKIFDHFQKECNGQQCTIF